MTTVIARIILRYLAGALVAYGLLPAEVGETMAMDQELALLLGTVLGMAVELFYTLVRKYGGER